MSAVDLASGTDRDDQHHETAILDAGDDPVVSYAMAPKTLAITSQWVAEAAWILAARNAVTQVS